VNWVFVFDLFLFAFVLTETSIETLVFDLFSPPWSKQSRSHKTEIDSMFLRSGNRLHPSSPSKKQSHKQEGFQEHEEWSIPSEDVFFEQKASQLGSGAYGTVAYVACAGNCAAFWN
jgi:hypothetical protein